MDPTATNYNEDLLWIHCNCCYALNCCPALTPKGTHQNHLEYRCPLCDKIVLGCRIGNHMPEHLKNLFQPQPWLEQLPFQRIYKFQSTHAQHLQKRCIQLHLQLKALDESRKNTLARTHEALLNYKQKQLETENLLKRAKEVTALRREFEEKRLLAREKLELYSQTSGSSTTPLPRQSPKRLSHLPCSKGVPPTQTSSSRRCRRRKRSLNCVEN